MKVFTLVTMAFILTAAQASNEFDPVISKLDKRINQPQVHHPHSGPTVINMPVPLGLAYRRESSLWSSIGLAYDFLRFYDLTVRHRFLYFAAKANSNPHPERIEALKKWLKNENHLILSTGKKGHFSTEWSKHVDSIDRSIQELEAKYPPLEVRPNYVKIKSDDKEFLSEIREGIQAASLAGTNASPAFPIVAPRSDLLGAKGLEYLLYLGALLIAFFGGLAFRNSTGDKEKLDDNNEELSVLPALPETLTQEDARTIYFDRSVNIEEECRKVFEQSSHLLEIARLKVTPTPRSPFKTSVDAPVERVSEALAWLLKGTLAIANSSDGKISHLEWQCRENSGRVSLEFILHGLECDLKKLYLNTLVEGDASAPAHFGRSEMALSEHLATIGFKAGNKRTIISLGLDTLSSQLNH